jgi:uncharacterized membrane protein
VTDQQSVPALHGSAALGMVLLALVGVVTAGYLAVEKLLGQAPACGPIQGCDTVAASVYSDLFGVPMALLGWSFSVVLLAATLAWWRWSDRRVLLAVYGLGLFGVLVVAALTYLELAVIHAMCIWCVAYAASVVLGWLVAVLTIRSSE